MQYDKSEMFWDLKKATEIAKQVDKEGLGYDYNWLNTRVRAYLRIIGMEVEDNDDGSWVRKVKRL